MLVGWLCWGLTSQSTIFQSYRDGAIASWVINQYFRGVKCLAQGHNTAAVGLEPRTSRSGVRHSTTEPPRSPHKNVTFTPCLWAMSRVNLTSELLFWLKLACSVTKAGKIRLFVCLVFNGTVNIEVMSRAGELILLALFLGRFRGGGFWPPTGYRCLNNGSTKGPWTVYSEFLWEQPFSQCCLRSCPFHNLADFD